METLEKLAAIPWPVWAGLGCFVTVFVIFMRATSHSKVAPDYKVSKPEQPLWNGSPYIEHRRWTHPRDDQANRLPDPPHDN